MKMLIAQKQSELEETRRQKELYEKWINDYHLLRNNLLVLSGKLEENVLLPLGPRAVTPGKIVHTNEVMCLLGDNWFMECNTQHALGIIDRRIQKCVDTVKKLEQDMNLRQGWEGAVSQQLAEQT